MLPRSVLIDGLKVLAAQLIVLHHIVLYAPMAEVLQAWPQALDLLAGEARYMVQVFLVIGGYLAAQGLARQRAPLGRLLWARYLRLVPMLAVSLLAVLAASALLPPGRWPDWVTPWPTAGQFIAHLLLLQDLLAIPSLSAGVWYVAIDLQLYALLALGTVLWRRPGRPAWQGPLPWVVAGLALASLAVVNRNPSLDVWGLYFFAAYGLGALAAFAGHSRHAAVLFAGLWLLMLAAALFDGRPRLGLAALTALLLWAGSRPAASAARAAPQRRLANWLAGGSDASYNLFLIHYAVIVAATALWLRWGPGGTAAAWAMLLGCWAAAWAAGAMLQRLAQGPLARLVHILACSRAAPRG
jgi:peptidoglycan/LPS O-acetylase OafA/YrhL